MSKELQITIAGSPKTGKSAIACIIEEALQRAGLTDIKMEGFQEDVHLTPLHHVECIMALRENGVSITIRTQQTARVPIKEAL